MRTCLIRSASATSVTTRGDSGLRSRCDTWGDDETTTIYPGATSDMTEPIPTPAGSLPTDGYQFPTPAVPGPGPSGQVPGPAGQLPQALPATPPSGSAPRLKPAGPARPAAGAAQGSIRPMGYAAPQAGQSPYGQVRPAAYRAAPANAPLANTPGGSVPVHLPPLNGPAGK